MDPQALYRTLEGTFDSNAAIRHEAENQLKQAETMPGYLQIIFQVSCAPEVQETVRLAAALRLKNSLKNQDWNSEKSPVQPDEKTLIKKSIVISIIAAPSKVRNVLLESLRIILQCDFPERWPTLVDEVVSHLQGQDMERILGALSVLRVVAKRFEFKQDDDLRAPLDEAVVKCFPLLVQMFQYINSQPTPPPEAAMMQKLLCKIYWSSTNMKIPPMFFANPSHLAQWLNCFLHVLTQPVQTMDPRDAQWKVKKWVGHIVNRLITRYGNPKGLKKPEQQLGQAFLDNYAVKFLEGWMNLCSWYRAKQYVSPQVLAIALNYMDSAVDYKPTCDILNANLDVLLSEIIFPLLCFTEADAELWKDNPQEYIRKLYDPIGDIYNPRLAATNLLLNFCHPKKPFHVTDCLPRFLSFVNAILSKYQADAQKDFQAKDGCLYVIGSIRRLLRKNDNYKSVLEPLLITHVVPEFQSPHGFLRSQACWVCGRYSGIDWQNAEALATIVRQILALMHDSELPVRIQAGTSLRDFIKIKKTQELVQPMLEQMVNSLFNLMNEIDNDSVIETLELIIEKFGDNLANAAISLCRMLCEHFVKTNPNLNGDNDEEKESHDEEVEVDQALAAAACLRALCTLVAAVHDHEELYPQMEQYFIPLFKLLLTNEKSEYLDETLELVSRLTYFQKKISPEMWQVVFPMIIQAHNDWAPDYLTQMLTPIDNFISRDPASFCRSGYNNVRYIQMVYAMMEKCLADEDMREEFSTCPKIMDSILQNCRDYQAEVNDYVPKMFDLIMRTMQQHPDMGEGFKVLCMNVIALGLFYNAQLTIQYLAEHQILAPVFNMWLGAVPGMSRYYDKKVSAIGLSALLQAMNTHGTGWLPATFFNLDQMKTIAGMTIKLVLECHEERKNIDAQSEANDEDSDEGSDDDDDDDDDALLEDDDQDVDADFKANPGGFQFSVDNKGENLEKLPTEAKDIKFNGKANFLDDDDDELEDEDYECVIMDLEDSLIFRDVMGEMAIKHPDLYSMVMGSLTDDAKKQLEDAVKYAETKKQEKAEADAKKASSNPNL